jgi:hypothetical protein
VAKLKKWEGCETLFFHLTIFFFKHKIRIFTGKKRKFSKNGGSAPRDRHTPDPNPDLEGPAALYLGDFNVISINNYLFYRASHIYKLAKQ